MAGCPAGRPPNGSQVGDYRRVFFYAHPAYCPSCRTPRQPEGERCPQCGLIVRGEQADRLYALLAEADAVLERLRETSTGQAAAIPDPVPAPPQPGPDQVPAPDPVVRGRVTTGAVLLALGALLLVIAAAVFVAVAWGSLSLSARTVLLLGVTALVGLGAMIGLRRQLRASTETLWSITVLLLLVDLAAAYVAGLAGADELGIGGLLAAAAVVTGLPSVAVGMLARRAWDPETGRSVLGAAELAVVGAALAAVAALAWDWDHEIAWLALASLALLAGLAVGARLAGLAWAPYGIAGLAAAAYVAAIGAAVEQLVTRPDLSEAVGGSAWPALVLLVVTVAVAFVGWAPVQTPATVIAVGLAAIVVVLPAAAAGRVQGTFAAVAVTLAPAVAGVGRRGRRRDGARVAATLGAALLAAALFPHAGRAVEAAAEAATPVWATRLDVELPGVASVHPWLALVLGAGIAAVAVLARFWAGAADREDADLPPAEVLGTIASLAVLTGVTTTVLSQELPVAVVTGVTVVAALVAAATRRPMLLVPAVTLVPVGIAVSMGSAGLTAIALGSAAAAALVQAGVGRAADRAVPLALVGLVLADSSAPLAILAVAGVVDDQVVVAVVLAGTVAFTALGAVPAVSTRWQAWARPAFGAELAGVLGLPVSAQLAAAVGPGTTAVALTFLGATAVVVGVVRDDRAPVRWLGLALIQVAWIIRLLDREVEVVEVYTLPLATVLVAVGLWTLYRERHARTPAVLLPGLSLAVLPSLPQAADDPTSVRAWLVGAAGLLLVAAAVRLRWSAPLAVGAVAVIVVGLAHLVTFAAAVPRWVVLAAAGSVLLAAGITWESRVRDARAFAAYVGDLR